jgi:hypothetical protein
VAVTLEIVMLELPLFVSVALNELLAPTFTFPKPRLGGFTFTREVDTTPVPAKEIVNGELGALLTSETEPLAAPADVGVKTALKVDFPPAPIVSGVVRPVMLKPAPETLA